MVVRPTPADGQIPELAYRTVGTIPFDNASIEGFNDGSQRKVQIKGYAGAGANTVPTKTANGLVWQTPAGGGITIGSDDIAVIGFEWVGSSSHADFAQHPYTIKAVRGKLEVSNGQLVIAEKPALAQYIQTTPLSQEQAT